MYSKDLYEIEIGDKELGTDFIAICTNRGEFEPCTRLEDLNLGFYNLDGINGRDCINEVLSARLSFLCFNMFKLCYFIYSNIKVHNFGKLGYQIKVEMKKKKEDRNERME